MLNFEKMLSGCEGWMRKNQKIFKAAKDWCRAQSQASW
jgi:hypothetical protein